MSEGMDALVMARELSKRLAALEAKVSKLDFDISVLCSVTGASLAPQTTPPQPAPQEGEWVVHREDLARAVERAEKAEADAATARGLLGRIVKYATEDRAVTPGSTRLERAIIEVGRFLFPPPLSSSPPPATEKAQETNSTGWPTRCGGDGSLMRWAPTTKPEHKPCPGCPDCKSEVKS